MAIMSKLITVVALNAIVALGNPFAPLLARQGAQACRNQSCAIATVAGSTGSTTYDFSYYPSGDTQDGDCCIIQYFPAVAPALYSARPNLQQYCTSTGQSGQKDANPPGVNSLTVTKKASKARDVSELRNLGPISATEDLVRRDTAATVPCRPNILIFVKGTFEPGDVGVTIGNTISQNLDTSKWQVVGVNYDNSFNNNYCLALPGGVTARPVINQVMTTCPSSQIVVGGYSQGAMVVRNAIARIPAAQVAKIANVITFGDPFCGAKIGQYSGPVNTWCNSGDGVCDGTYNINFDHLSYSAGTNQAIALLKSIQK